MKLSDTDFNLPTRETFSQIIDEGEDILWSGSPEGKSPVVATLPALLFSLIWMAIPSFAIYQTTQGEGSFKLELWIIIPLIFIVVGLMIPVMMYLHHKRQRQSSYVLTDKRAILLIPAMLCGAKVFTYPVEEDMVLEVSKKKNGSGTIVFDYSDVVVNGKPLPRGFLNIKNVDKPLSILKEMGVKAGQESIEC